MATIANVKDFFTQDLQTGWLSVKESKVKNQATAQVIVNQCVFDARMERLKAAGKFTLGAGMIGIAAAAVYIVGHIAAWTLGIFVLPLVIIPPLYNLITFVGGLSIGGASGYIVFAKYAKHYLKEAQNHWNYSDHLYQQTFALELKKAQLPA